jgi:hypothetical protein
VEKSLCYMQGPGKATSARDIKEGLKIFRRRARILDVFSFKHELGEHIKKSLRLTRRALRRLQSEGCRKIWPLVSLKAFLERRKGLEKLLRRRASARWSAAAVCLFNEKAGAVLSKPNQQQPFYTQHSFSSCFN